MAPSEYKTSDPDSENIRWLLDSDPAIRWQVMRDLLDEPVEALTAERDRISVEGWGAKLLQLQQSDGDWGSGPWAYQSWASTMETLMLLRELGVDPASSQVREAIALVKRKSDWGKYHNYSPFFRGRS